MTSFRAGTSSLEVVQGQEVLRVEAWGPHSVRVRAALSGPISDGPASALLAPPGGDAEVEISDGTARLRNGDLVVEVSEQSGHSMVSFPPRLRFVRADGTELLSEVTPHFSSPPQRRYSPAGAGVFRCEVSFGSRPDERFYGLGQHQHGLLDQKGAVIDLVQRNTEVIVPFTLSDQGYGLLWNMPGVGRVELGTNRTRWVAEAAHQIDYWVTTGSTPAEIVGRYVAATGLPPMLPAWAAGFWQSKLRYRTQEELLTVAREHKRRGLPLSVIVVDYFHWTRQGEWRFDPQEWPDPKAMVEELSALGVELMVSIWPTVNPDSANYAEMDARGLLVGNTRGLPLHLDFWDKGSEARTFVRYYDATNPEARRYIWQKVEDGYGRYGIRAFWLDACEPEIRPENPEETLYHFGQGSAVQCVYPREHARGFADGLAEKGEPDGLLLCRSAWAGSQRYPVVLWSGDIKSTFEALARQVTAGLNVGISGIPWWTTDIGGFEGGDPTTPYFRELVVRWFQYGVFCPIFRLHGVREPGPLSGAGQTGAPNEVWSFGDEAYAIITEQLTVRERLRPYLMEQMATASATGVPPMRALFLEFPKEPVAWDVGDEFMLGPDVLVAPVTEHGARARQVYLPDGASWVDAWTGEPVGATGWITASAPLEHIPVYLRLGGALASLSAEAG